MKLKNVAVMALTAGVIATVFTGCFRKPLPSADVQKEVHPEFVYKLAQISDTTVDGAFQKVLSLEFETVGYNASTDSFRVSMDGNAVDATIYKGYVCADEHMNTLATDAGYKTDLCQNTIVIRSDSEFSVDDLKIEVNPYAIMDTEDVIAKPVHFNDWVELKVNAEKDDMHLQQKFLHGQSLFALNDNLYVVRPSVDADATAHEKRMSIVPLVGSLDDLASYMRENMTAVFGLPVYSYPAPANVIGGAAAKEAIENLYNTAIPAPAGASIVVETTDDGIVYHFDVTSDAMSAFEATADVRSDACTNLFASMPSIVMPNGETMVMTDTMTKTSKG